MEKKTEYRKITKGDQKEIEKMLHAFWGLNKYFEKEQSAEQFGKIQVLRLLKNSTFTEAAIINHKVAGVVIGTLGKNRYSYGFKGQIGRLQLMLEKSDRKSLKTQKQIEQMEQKLLSGCTAEAQLLFLSVNEKYKNTDIMEHLLKKWEEYLCEKGCSTYAAVLGQAADTNCYEKKGFIKSQKEELMVQPAEQRFRAVRMIFTKAVSK